MNLGAVRVADSCCLCHRVAVSHSQVISLGFCVPSLVSPSGDHGQESHSGGLPACHPACVTFCGRPAVCNHLWLCGHAVVCCLLSSEGSLEIGCERKGRNKFKTLVSGTSPQIGPANPCMSRHVCAQIAMTRAVQSLFVHACV